MESTPFSLIRLGDGEGRVLMWPDEIEQEMMDRHLRFWFGHTDVDMLRIRRDLEWAIREASMIGCYQEGRRSDFWNYPAKYLENIGRPPDCGIDIHRKMLKAGTLDKFIQEARDVVLVTCRDIEDRFSEHYGRKPLVLSIPEESNTSRKRNDHWEQYDDIRSEIAGVARPGDLVLVGAGVLGKIYTVDAGKCGAIALDIGSIFDGWAGVHSRSYLTKEYKL